MAVELVLVLRFAWSQVTPRILPHPRLRANETTKAMSQVTQIYETHPDASRSAG